MLQGNGIQLENHKFDYLYNTSLISYLDLKSSGFENINYRFESFLHSANIVFINRMNSDFYQSKEIEVFITLKHPFFFHALPPPIS